MSYGRSKGIFDGLPIPADKSYLKEELSRIDESWAAARFDSLPHVVHILTSKDRETDAQFLKDQSDVVEEVVDEVVHAYHGGFNKAIQNYSQILRLFSESAESISTLKVDIGDSKELLGSHNKQLRQLWYRSLTLRHIISLLDQIESVSKVPARIEKLIAEKQLYAAIQLHVQSTLLLEREGLQVVGALQDIRSDLGKLRGLLFYNVLEGLHSHLFNKGDYSCVGVQLAEGEAEIPALTTAALVTNSSLSLSRRTRSSKLETQSGISAIGDGGSSFDGRDEESMSEVADSISSDGFVSSSRLNNGDSYARDAKANSRKTPVWLSLATPDEFIEAMKRSDATLNVKYLQTLVECLFMLGKVAAAGVIICQRLRPTIHEMITSKIKNFSAASISKKPCGLQASTHDPFSYQSARRKPKNGSSFNVSQLVVSPVSQDMTPMGTTQSTASQLLSSILDLITEILENHIIVGELLDSKSGQQGLNANTLKMTNGDKSRNPESDHLTGGFSVGFCLTVIQSECQQLICEILRATPETASADAVVQTARLASKTPSKDTRDASEGLSFAFRFTEVSASLPNQGASQGWKKGSNVQQEGYGTSIVLSEQGIYLAASIYRPVVQFTEKISSLLPWKYSQLGNDGLLTFIENFLKDHFLPAMFVDYRKCIQQAISNPAAFRPRAHAAFVYNPFVEKGRPVLQGLLATDMLAKEVLAWSQAMPKYSSELVEYVKTFLERAYERCRTSYTEAVLERQSYMLIGRQDMEKLMHLDPANACLTSTSDPTIVQVGTSDSETIEIESEMSELLLGLRPIRQENLIRDDHKFILLACLSDSLEYEADSIERLGNCTPGIQCHNDDFSTSHPKLESAQTLSLVAKALASLSAEYRKLAIDCLKVLRVEMQLETIFHLQELTRREYLEDQDVEEPDDFVISLTAQIMRRDEEMGPFVADVRRSYIFGGICGIAANATIKALAEMKSINLLGVQQICRNTIALEQALAAIPLINCEAVQQRFDRVRTYYELLNLPFEALLAFIRDNVYLFSSSEYSALLKVNVPGREVPPDFQDRLSELLNH